MPWTNGSQEDDQEGGLVDHDQLAANVDNYEPAEVNTDDTATDQRKPVVYTSQSACLFIIVNVTIGVGLLAMPFAMESAGIVTSMLIQLFFVVLVISTSIMCIELTVKGKVDSYHQFIKLHCHPIIYQFTQVSIFLITFGTTAAYIFIVGDQTDRLFASWYGPSFCYSWYMNRRFVMSAITLTTIKPLCCARTVDFLKYGSFIGVASIGLIFYAVTAEFIKADKIATDVNYIPVSWANIIAILPLFCLSYQCHLSLVPTIATVRRKEKPKSYITIAIAMLIAMLIYSTICILTTLTFGSKIQKDLTGSLSDKWYTMTAIGVVALKCVLTLPAIYLPARISLIEILTDNWTRFAQLSEPIKRYSVTLVFLDAALLTAICIPNILAAVNMLGFLCVMIVFTLPGLAYLGVVKENRLLKQHADGQDARTPDYTTKDKMKIFTSYFMIVFGLVMAIVVLYQSIAVLYDQSSSSAPICHH